MTCLSPTTPDATTLDSAHAEADPSQTRHGYGIVEVEHINGQSLVTRDRAHAPAKLICPRRLTTQHHPVPNQPASNHPTPDTPSNLPSSPSANQKKPNPKSNVLRDQPVHQLHQRPAWVYTSSFGGGLVAGDHIHLDVEIGSNASCVLTTQASTKVYHARNGQAAKQTLEAQIHSNGLLVLWPDFITCFQDAAYEQKQSFELAADANLIAMECYTCGRLAMGERWAFERYTSRNTFKVDGKLIGLEATTLDRNQTPLHHPLRTGIFNAMATVHLIGPLFQTISQTLAQQARQTPLTTTHHHHHHHHHQHQPHPNNKHNRPNKSDPQTILAANVTDHGLCLRAAGTQTQALCQAIQSFIQPVFDSLGFTPWTRKW